jgi:Sugar phosphate permease
MTEQKLAGRTGTALVIMCFLAYMSAYFGRLDFSAAMPQMLALGIFDKQAAGFINTAFYLVYGGGQLLFGVLGDKVSPFALVGGGLLGSALSNFAMFALTGGDSVNIAPLILIWAVNGLAQSALWSPIIRILSTMLEPRAAVAACSNMLIACNAGTVGSYPLSTLLLKTSGWRTVFFVPSLILLTAALGWAVAYSALRKRGISEVNNKISISCAADNLCTDTKTQPKRLSLFNQLVISGVLFMFPTVLFMGMVREGISSWTPVLLTELYGGSPSDSVLITTVVPLVSVFGVVIARRLHERYHLNNMIACALYFAAIALCYAVLLPSGTALPFTVGALALASTFGLALNAVQVSIIPAHFARFGHSGAVCGILNGIAAFAYSASSVLIGATQPLLGWRGCAAVWIAMSLFSVALSLTLVKRWKRFAGEDA